MALDTAQVDARRYRRPWYWLVILFLAAAAATVSIAANARSRIEQNDRQFDSSQSLRLQRIEQRVDDYFGDASQLAAAAAELVGRAGGDRALAQRLVLGLYQSRRSPQIYGLGAFYEPYAVDPAARTLSYYAHGNALAPRGGGAVERDYTNSEWYRLARGEPSVLAFAGPYSDAGRSFVSALKAIRYAGHTIGVVSVDTLAQSFRGLLTQPLAAGDIAYARARDGTWLLGTAPFPKDMSGLVDRSEPLRYTHALIYLFADATPLRAADRRIVTAAIAQTAMVWTFALLIAYGIGRNWRAQEAARRLEAEQARLENEIAIGKKIEGELRKAAYTDALTGLPNRLAFLESASSAIAGTSGDARYAVFFIDLDRFNLVNDTLGHLAGDELLKLIASRLHDALPINASISRLGGDEFVVCAPVAPAVAGEFGERILACLHEPMLLGGRSYYTTASIGIVIVDPGYRTPDELLRDADIAMYAAKERGRARCVLFDTAMRRKVAAESDLENDLRRAIERREFVPYYQPIVEIATRDVTSFEALVRWNRPGSGVISAGEFIGYAEARGLVDQIDALVLDGVCADAATLFAHFPAATVAVNVSAGHLTAPGLAALVHNALLTHGVAPARIRLEITETAIMTNAELARATLEQLRSTGVQSLLDDFGAGQSSLSYLHRLPIAGLKIDRSFITPLGTDEQAEAIVRSIVALAQALGLSTVAEGVETAEQLAIVRDLGVVYAQGFFFSPALPLADLIDGSARSNAS